MSPQVSEQDLIEVRELITGDPGTALSRLKLESRHARARVREAVRILERRGEVLVVSDGAKQYVWPMTAVDDAATVLAKNRYQRVSFDDH